MCKVLKIRTLHSERAFHSRGHWGCRYILYLCPSELHFESSLVEHSGQLFAAEASSKRSQRTIQSTKVNLTTWSPNSWRRKKTHRKVFFQQTAEKNGGKSGGGKCGFETGFCCFFGWMKRSAMDPLGVLKKTLQSQRIFPTDLWSLNLQESPTNSNDVCHLFAIFPRCFQ